MTRLRRWLLALVLCAAGIGPADAGKLVGVVFDDSGSMAKSYNLPLLGLQMLAATLNGSIGGDRLLISRLDWDEHPPAAVTNGTRITDRVSEIALGPDETTLQGTVDAFAGWTIPSTGRTPYRPIEEMLSTLSAQATTGQEVHLIVFTDGFFIDPDSVLNGAEARFREIRRRLDEKKVRLRVDFLLILNKDPKEVETMVGHQRIRSGLLTVFNGDTQTGAHAVKTFDELRRAMLTIIAEVSDTDARRSSSVVTRNGETVDIALPFAVSRVITLTPGRPVAETAGPSPIACPALTDPADPTRPLPGAIGIDRVEARRLSSCGRMQKADTLPTWNGSGRWGFVATQFFPSPYLQPGRHTLRFDRPVGDDTTLLFRTDLSVGWALSNGTDVLRSDDTGGEPRTITITDDLTLDVFVKDRLDGDRITRFEDFPRDATFSASVGGPEGSRDVALAFDRARARVFGRLPKLEAGDHTIEVRMVLAGAPSQSSGRAAFTVRRRAEFEMTVEPGERHGGHFTVTTRAGRLGGPAKIATATITAKEGISGRMKLSVDDLPEGVAAILDGAEVPPDGRIVDFAGRRPIRIDLVRDDRWTGLDGDLRLLEPHPVIRAVEIPEGRGRTGGSIEGIVDLTVTLPEARLTPLRRAAEPPSDEVRSIALRDLPSSPDRTSPSLAFTLEGAVVPPRPEDFTTLSTAFGDRLGRDVVIAPTSSPGTHEVTVRFAAGYCARCLLGFWASETGSLDLAFHSRAGQSAAARVPLSLDPTAAGRIGPCLGMGLVLLAALWVLGWILSWLLAYTFPRGSHLMVEQAGNHPSHRKLAYPGTFLVAALWPVWPGIGRRIRQKIAREGLSWVACPGGVEIMPTGHGWPDYTAEHNGLTLEQQSPAGPGGRAQPIFLPWGTALIDRTRRRVIGLYESRADAVERYADFFRR
jgi:hypothetical protein